MIHTTPIRVGLVGLGRHGLRYARHLVSDVSNACVVAVARRRLDQGLPFAAPPDLTAYDDPLRLITDDRVDAVVAVAPPVLFHPICLASAAAGKPLLVEKPLAPTGALALEMVGAMEAASTPLMVAQTLRFNRALCAFRVLASKVGQIRRLALTLTVPPRIRPSGNPGFLGRGPLLDLGVHLFDLARWLLGFQIVTLQGDVQGGTEADVEQAALVELDTSDGCRCVIRVGWEGTFGVGEGEMIGDFGQARVDWIAHRVEFVPEGEAAVVEVVPEAPTIVATLRGFLDALASGAPMPVSARDGLCAVRLVDASYESALRRTPVTVDLR